MALGDHACCRSKLVTTEGFSDETRRWRLVAEFLEEYRWEPPEKRAGLLDQEPAPTGDEHGDVFLAASPEHLLAMKVLAARRRDAEDIRFLVEHLGLTSAEQVLSLCAEIFPEEVPGRARLVLDDVFDSR